MKSLQSKKYKMIMGASKYLFIFIIFMSFLLPLTLTKAAFDSSNTGGFDASNTDKSSVNITNKIENPLNGSINDIPSLIKAILNIVLIIGVPIVALAIIYTGFLFVKAQGKPEEITKAKKALMYTLIGAALLLGSWVIANAIGNTINEIKRTA